MIENPIVKKILKIRYNNALETDTGVLIHNRRNELKIWLEISAVLYCNNKLFHTTKIILFRYENLP